MFFTQMYIKLKALWEYIVYPSKYYAEKYAKKYAKEYSQTYSVKNNKTVEYILDDSRSDSHFSGRFDYNDYR